MIKVLTVGHCESCIKFIEILKYNKIEFEEVREPLGLHKYLQHSTLPILLDNNGNEIDKGEFLMGL